MTWMIRSKIAQKAIEGYLELFEQKQIDFYPAHLTQAKSELLLRVESEECKPTHKISCANRISAYLE